MKLPADHFQRLRHAENSPALIQIGYGDAAQLGRDLPRQAGKAEHLRIKRKRVSADSAQLPLRLMAVLFRDKQESPSLPFRNGILYLCIDQGGLPRPSLPGNNSQHGTLLCSYLFYIILSHFNPSGKNIFHMKKVKRVCQSIMDHFTLFTLYIFSYIKKPQKSCLFSPL